MKFFIISDIHGSVSAFKQCEEALKREKANFLVIAGDYLNHGPRNPIPEGYNPEQLAKNINAWKNIIMGVRGNCDSEVDQMLLEFPCTSDYLVFFSGTRRCFVTHGHLYENGKHPPLQNGNIFISGHTHVPSLQIKEGLIYLNPGSPSLPKENNPPSYALIDPEGIYIKELNGNIMHKIIY